MSMHTLTMGNTKRWSCSPGHVPESVEAMQKAEDMVFNYWTSEFRGMRKAINGAVVKNGGHLIASHMHDFECAFLKDKAGGDYLQSTILFSWWLENAKYIGPMRGIGSENMKNADNWVTA